VSEVARVIGIACILAAAGAGCSTRTLPPGGEHDLGVVFAQHTPELSHTFIVENTTDREVTILDETHTCTCSSVKLEKWKLSPGESTRLAFTARPPDGVASMDIRTILRTDHPVWPEWTYRLRFRTYPIARIVPSRVDMGTARIADNGSNPTLRPLEGPPYLEIFYPSDKPEPRVTEITCPEGFRARIAPAPEVDIVDHNVKRARYVIDLESFGPHVLSGTFSRTMRASVGNFPAEAAVCWSVFGPFELEPMSVHFGIVGRGDVAERRIKVRSTCDRPFRIVALRSTGSAIEPEAEIEGGQREAEETEKTISLRLRIPQSITRRAMAGTVEIVTDHEASSVVKVPWSAFLRSSDGGDKHSLKNERREDRCEV
jgi:hypothetical protein